MRRINKYMSGDELDQHSISHDLSVKEPILVREASFSWTKTDAQTLKNISISVPKQKLVAIVGTSGRRKIFSFICITRRYV
jgi:ABC-type bacteriocin/lantibiotic exporter with double-glycine peptidase domain